MVEPLFLYNTLTRSKDEFKPLQPGRVGLYTCGPTVYNYAHIGNLRTYLFEDFLKRTLKLNGFTVDHVMNITDVGHLTGDGDDGQEKLEVAQDDMLYIECQNCKRIIPSFLSCKRGTSFDTLTIIDSVVVCSSCGYSNKIYKKGVYTNLFYNDNKKEKVSIWDIAAFYTTEFKKNLHDLNIIEPNTWCKATDYISEQIDFIQKLEAKGLTYKTSDGIYFDTAQYSDYAKLAKLNIEGQQAGARVEVNTEKRNATDFALWKFSPQDEKRQMEWMSPWGIGFPGWHIECSAMSIDKLGSPFDIHCGGIDHIPVHHTNERAQNWGLTGTEVVHTWMHGEFLVTNEAKMAKSGDNFITVQTLIDKGFDPLAYRYLCLQTHYRQKLNFSWEALESANKGLQSLREEVRRLEGEGETDKKSYHEFFTAINDDLNLPKALATIRLLLKNEAISAATKRATVLACDAVLGLALDKTVEKAAVAIPAEVQTLAEERLAAKKVKDFAKADDLRTAIERHGFIVKDGSDGYQLEKK